MTKQNAPRLTPAELADALSELRGWETGPEGASLTRTYSFPDAEDGYRFLSYLACVAQIAAHHQPMLTASAEVVHVLLPPTHVGLTHEHLDFAHAAEVVAGIFAADLRGPDERMGRFPACPVVPFHPLGRLERVRVRRGEA